MLISKQFIFSSCTPAWRVYVGPKVAPVVPARRRPSPLAHHAIRLRDARVTASPQESLHIRSDICDHAQPSEPRHRLNRFAQAILFISHIVARILWKGATPTAEAVGGSNQPEPIMSQPPGQPHLSPQFCFSFGTLRDFLRLSRSSIDDSITQNLNALVTPARTGFDPGSTSKRTPRSFAEPIGPEACQSFKEKVLFPSWKARAEVLSYCGIVATSPDPDDPEATILELEKQKDGERIVDERLDPYSGRFFPREARTQSLAILMRQERAVENIVRSRTWDVIQGRCGASGQSWQDAMSKWEDARKLSRGDENRAT